MAHLPALAPAWLNSNRKIASSAFTFRPERLPLWSATPSSTTAWVVLSSTET